MMDILTYIYPTWPQFLKHFFQCRCLLDGLVPTIINDDVQRGHFLL